MGNSQKYLLPAYLHAFSLESKTILITGGTGDLTSLVARDWSFIGRSFASAGADLISLQLATDSPIVKGIAERHGQKCSLVTCDLMDLETLPKVIEAVLSSHDIDILVNCAGIFKAGPTPSFTITSMEDIFKVNVTACVVIASTCVKKWLSHQSSEREIKKIINFASIASFQGNVETLAYSASKAAVLNMTRSMSNEWAPYGILVNSVCPGYTKSAITKHLYEDDEYNKRIMPGIPCRRWADGDNLAGTLIYLASSASNYVSGTCAM